MSPLAEQAANGPDEHHEPFSLKKAFGKRYRILMEESFETAEHKKGQEAWYEQILCLNGHIMLFTESPEIILEYYTPTARPTAVKIYEKFKGVPGVRLDKHFSGSECLLYFPVHLLGEVAELAGARRRRVLSPEHKAKLAEAGKATRFNPGFHGSKERQNPPKGVSGTRRGERAMGK